jgi:hypothetical protein
MAELFFLFVVTCGVAFTVLMVVGTYYLAKWIIREGKDL